LKLALVTCHFNPQNYQQQRVNYFRFREQLGRPLTTVELSFSGDFAIDDSIRIRGFRNLHALWQKERLLNIAIGALPDRFDAVAWLDADLVFLNPNWYRDTIAALEQYPIVQMAERIHHTDRSFAIEADRTLETFGWSQVHADKVPAGKWYHTGFAWAATRDAISEGLWDLDILGGGDAAMAFAWTGSPDKWTTRYRSPGQPDCPLRRTFIRWAERNGPRAGRRVGYVPGEIVHLWHGDKANRKYVERTQLLIDQQFDPETDLQASSAGLWEWTGSKPQLQADVLEYFAARREDG